MIVAWGSCQEHSKFVVQAVRRGAPNTLIGTGINPGAYEARLGLAGWDWRLGGDEAYEAYGNIGGILMVHVTIYTIHGSYG